MRTTELKTCKACGKVWQGDRCVSQTQDCEESLLLIYEKNCNHYGTTAVCLNPSFNRYRGMSQTRLG